MPRCIIRTTRPTNSGMRTWAYRRNGSTGTGTRTTGGGRRVWRGRAALAASFTMILEPNLAAVKAMADPSSDLEEGCHPNHECERIVELWNLVFMQFYQDLEGGRTPLPAPSVDTGMGLERAAIVMQRHMSIYDTDLFQPLVAKASQAYGQ